MTPTPPDSSVSPPRVSVVMPARNAAQHVAAAVASVLAETDVPVELIVVDDGSTDATAAVLAGIDDPRLTVLPGPQTGISDALNTAAAAARGAFLARCDADDFFAEGRFAGQLAALEADPGAVAVAGGYATLDARGRELSVLDTGAEEADITEELRAGRTRTHLGTWLIRREAWEAVGGARPWFVCAQDLDLQSRLAGVGRVVYRPGVAYRYRLHDASITHTLADTRRLFEDEMVVAFAAQRLAGGRDDLDRGCPPEPPTGGDAEAKMSSAWQAQGHLMSASAQASARGRHGEAIRLLGRAAAADPGNAKRWAPLAKQGLGLAKRALLRR